MKLISEAERQNRAHTQVPKGPPGGVGGTVLSTRVGKVAISGLKEHLWPSQSGADGLEHGKGEG